MPTLKFLEPITLRHRTLRNRIVFGAHTANMSEQGVPGKRHLAYYLERAIGGVAMIVVEPMPVHASAVLTRGNFRVDDDSVIDGFRAITEACKAEGAVMLQQLYHIGQHGDYDLSFHANWSPSGLPSYHDGDGSHAMCDAEIEQVIDGFVRSAVRAKACGFEGVELWGAYNSLIEQFWLPWSNRREDRWGGSFDNRMRFSTEVSERVRQAAGDDFIIGLSTSIDDVTRVAMSIELLQEIAVYHDQRGLIDYITCGTGSYFDPEKIMPSHLFADKLGAPHAAALKTVCQHILVQAESHIRTPENANAVIGSGQADLVSIVRGQIADPHWVNKAAANNAPDIRGCISCNQMCWGRRSRDYWISCLVNPSAGREWEWGGDRFSAAADRKNILVVGGGPGGLEAARVAAERGHSVTLAEASPHAGGQFRLAGMQPRRAQILELIDWYERQLDRLGATVTLNSPLDADEILEQNADIVILAVGSLPAETGFQRWLPELEELPGVRSPNVGSVEDVMYRAARLGERVVLLDDSGDWRGLGTAMEITERGHQVTVVTPWPVVGRFIQRTSSDAAARARIKSKRGQFITESVITEWRADGANIRCLLSGTESFVAADSLVLATTNIANTRLHDELSTRDPTPRIEVIGDALAPRLAVAAIYEGRALGLSL